METYLSVSSNFLLPLKKNFIFEIKMNLLFSFMDIWAKLNIQYFPLTQYTSINHKRHTAPMFLTTQGKSLKPNVKGSDWLCMVVELSMQYCGQIL